MMSKNFIIHLSSDLEKARLYSYEDEKLQEISELKLTEITKLITPNSKVVLFIPSSLLGTYSVEKNESENNEQFQARFFANNDDLIITDISNNHLIFSESMKLAIIVDKSIIEPINKSMNQLGCSVSIFPEHFLNHSYAKDSCLIDKGRFIFSYADGTGFSCSENSLSDYLSLTSIEMKKYRPNCLSTSKEPKNKEIKGLGDYQSIKIETLHLHFLKQEVLDYPNLLKFQISSTGILRKLSFTRYETILSTVLVLGILILPWVNLKLLDIYESQYRAATLEIFQSINPNTKRVINPKVQMNQILESAAITESLSVNPRYLGVINNVNFNDIKKTSIDFNTGEIEIFFDETTSLKYSVLKGLTDQLDLTLVEDNLVSTDGGISGSIKMRFETDE